MTFTIFKKTGEIHFDHNGVDDYDGDEGYDIEIEVDDEQVHDDVAAMIFDDYFCKTFSSVCPIGYYSISRKKMIEQIKLLLDNLDAWNSVIELYADKLCKLYEGRI